MVMFPDTVMREDQAHRQYLMETSDDVALMDYHSAYSHRSDLLKKVISKP